MDARTTLPLPGTSNHASEQLTLALVIPTLDEAGNIAPLLREVHSALEPLRISYEIIVVDDDSSDGTGAVVAAIAREDSRVRLLARKGERGLAGAILDGWRQTGAEVLGVMDADFQHPPELLPELIAAISGGSDLAIGSRYATGGRLRQWNRTRRLASALAVGMTWPLQKGERRARDPLSGFFLVRRRCLHEVSFQRAGFKLLLEILVRGRVDSIQEVPFTFGRRFTGSSKANFKVAWEYSRLLGRLYAGRFGSVNEDAWGSATPVRRLLTLVPARAWTGRAQSLAQSSFFAVPEPTRSGGDLLKEIAASPHAALAVSEAETP